MSPFYARTFRPISTKFCTDLPTNSGKVLNISMTPPTQLLDPRVPQTLKPKWVKGEKTLCNVKCPDGLSKLIKFFPGSAGARLASIYIKQTVCTYVPLSQGRGQGCFMCTVFFVFYNYIFDQMILFLVTWYLIFRLWWPYLQYFKMENGSFKEVHNLPPLIIVLWCMKFIFNFGLASYDIFLQHDFNFQSHLIDQIAK